MAAEEWQVELVGDSRELLEKRKFKQPDYVNGKFGEKEYRLACKLIAEKLESGKITVRHARKLLAQAETRLRVHRPAVSMEVSIAQGQLSNKKLGSVKENAIKQMGNKNDYKNNCLSGGYKTCNFRIKTKGSGRDLL